MEKIRPDVYLASLKTRKSNAKSERSEVVKKFVDILNKQRVEHGLKVLKAGFYAFKMSHLDLWDLQIFFKSCEDSQNFSSRWWWALKPYKDEQY